MKRRALCVLVLPVQCFDIKGTRLFRFSGSLLDLFQDLFRYVLWLWQSILRLDIYSTAYGKRQLNCNCNYRCPSQIQPSNLDFATVKMSILTFLSKNGENYGKKRSLAL